MAGEFQGRGGRVDERLVCRHAHGAASGRWTRKEEEPKYAPDRTCDVEHLRLEVEVDLPRRTVEAVCTQTLRAAYGPFRSVTLDAAGLQIHSVRDGDGRALEHTYLGDKLTIRFPSAVEDEARLVIEYRVVDPVDGLYFQGPNDAEPNATWQVWSQGENEGARHWIPCHDAPNERMTTEILATAGEEFTVVSNGRLLGVESLGGRRRWHYLESVPHPSYLITLVVGVYKKIEDRWKDIPVEYYVEPGREEEARRSFGRTPEMIEFFSNRLECPYPYEKYAQVTVRHFHFGGMENTSATTQTEGTLHDERASADFTSDELVAHELAHQWFGDLITCKNWTHAWLNEGFATYFEALWKEEDKGRDEFDYEMVRNAADYMSESYRRPIASPRYAYPFELFDQHLYPKGGWVLHMLRCKVGDDLFWKSMRLYVKRHGPGPAETIDLIRAFEEASGKNLAGFFDQWIFAPGHPVLEGELSWDGDAGWVKLSVKQTQKREHGTPVFRIPLRMEACLPDGKRVGSEFQMEEPEQTFYLPLAAPPLWVAVDPEGAVLRETKIRRPIQWSESALVGTHADRRIFSRVDVVRQLGEDAGTRAVEILGRVLLDDPFWGVQAEAAGVLGRIHAPAALDHLIAGCRVTHPKARRAVVTALGEWRGGAALDALRRFVQEGDSSYFVQGAAAAAYGRAGGMDAAADLKRKIKDGLERREWHDVGVLGAAEGLAATRDPSAVDDLFTVASDRRLYWRTRVGAMEALGDLGAARHEVSRRVAEGLARFLDDPEFLVASRMPEALIKLGDASALPALRRKGESAARPDMREECLKAAMDLEAQARRGEDLDRLRADLEKLRDEAKAMKESLEAVRSKVLPEKEALPATTAAGAGAPDGTRVPAGAAGTAGGTEAPGATTRLSGSQSPAETKAPARTRTPSRPSQAGSARKPPQGKGGGSRPRRS